MPWSTLGLLGVLTLWAACGLVPWFVALVAARGRGALVALPIAAAAGVAGGAIVPPFRDDALGLAISAATAFVAGAAVSVAVVRLVALTSEERG